MSSPGRGRFQGRRAAAAVFGFFVVAGLVLVFSGTLARSTASEAEAARLQADIAQLEALVEAGAVEIRFLETEASAAWQARIQGYGEPGEKPFELPPSAPSPEPIVPLGGGAREDRARAPIDAWLDLLFGASGSRDGLATE